MALQKNITTEHGFDVINAYHRVEFVNLINKTQMTFHLRSYVNLEKPAFAEQVFSAIYSLHGDNPIKQAYEHLKTLPEFAGATDV